MSEMSGMIAAPFALPLVAAGLALLLRRSTGAQRIVTGILLVLLLIDAVSLVRATRDGVVIATRIGDWPAGLGIPFAADGFAALLLTAMVVMAAFAMLFAGARGEDRHPLFHPTAAVLFAGVLGSVVTADLFNLFVTFEVMLIGSYVLLTLRGSRSQVRAGTIYVAVNLLASTAFVAGIALVYGTAGTVAFVDLADAVAAEPATAVGLAIIVVAIGVKASLVPMHTWLPRTYVEAGPAVTALFSGLLTKAGVYVLLRLSSVVIGDAPQVRELLLAIALLTMIIGVLGAIGRADVRGILAFHMVSQVGYLLLPLGIWTVAGVTAGIVYLLQYILVKGALFLAAGTIETLTGTGRLDGLGGMLRTNPGVAIGFLLPALALAGLPPTSGFVGKVLLVRAAFDVDELLAGGIAIAVSLFTLLSMMKIWTGVFWGEPPKRSTVGGARAARGLPIPAGGADDSGPRRPSWLRRDRPADGEAARTSAEAPPTGTEVAADAQHRIGRVLSTSVLAGMIGPAILVGLLTIVVGIGAQGLVELVEPAARNLVDPTNYLEAVRGA